MKKLRVGLIGLGQIGRDRHLPFYLKNKDVDLIAICDLNFERMRGIHALKFESYRDMLKQDLDLIDIATPPFNHIQQSMDCLAAGSHILIEKPFTFTLSGCDKLLGYADSLKKKICVMHSSLFFPVLLSLKKQFSRIGNIKHIRMWYNVSMRNHVFCNEWIMKMPFQALDEQIPHIAYLIHPFMSTENVVVVKSKMGLTRLPFNHYSILLEGFEANAVIDLLYGDDWELKIELIGDQGKLFIDLLNQHYRFESLAEDLSKTSILRNMLSRFTSPFTYFHYLFKQYGHGYVIDQFVESLLQGSPPPVSHGDIREVVRLTEMINQASI